VLAIENFYLLKVTLCRFTFSDGRYNHGSTLSPVSKPMIWWHRSFCDVATNDHEAYFRI